MSLLLNWSPALSPLSDYFTNNRHQELSQSAFRGGAETETIHLSFVVKQVDTNSIDDHVFIILFTHLPYLSVCYLL